MSDPLHRSGGVGRQHTLRVMERMEAAMVSAPLREREEAPAARAELSIDDRSPSVRLPWLTPRRLIVFVIGWLTLFAVLSAFLSNPFQSEPNAAAEPDYARVMFLHGLLIGMVGLGALLTCSVLALRSLHVRLWIAGGVIIATVLAAVGGIWDRTIPGSEVPMWTQILGFFALDEILVLLLVGLFIEWRRGVPTARTLPYLAAAAASASMLVAAVMGHLVGWIMEFGVNTPSLIHDYMRFAGFGAAADFIDPAAHGAGYVLSTIGLVIVGLALIATVWAGLAGEMRRGRGAIVEVTSSEPVQFRRDAVI